MLFSSDIEESIAEYLLEYLAREYLWDSWGIVIEYRISCEMNLKTTGWEGGVQNRDILLRRYVSL